MKVTNVEGEWIGLAYWEDLRHQLDWMSNPDGWEIGFEVVYRLIFYTRDRRVMDKFKAGFKYVFALSAEHFELQEMSGADSVFWRVYWDRGRLDLELLEQCEKKLDEVAAADKTRVAIVSMVIIPRSLNYIHQQLQRNV